MKYFDLEIYLSLTILIIFFDDLFPRKYANISLKNIDYLDKSLQQFSTKIKSTFS